MDYFPEATFRNINYEFQTFAGLGAQFDLSAKWKTQVEWFGRQIRSVKTGDVYGGGQYAFSPEGSIQFGASLGSMEVDQSDLQYRLMVGLKWSPARTRIVTQEIRTKVETIQKIKTLSDCRPKTFEKTFTGRALKRNEIRNFLEKNILPYKTKGSGAVDYLNPGEKTSVNSSDQSFVKDSQVIFAIDITGLPEKNTVVTVKNLELSLSVNKLWTPGEENTDMLCFLKEQVCSGDLYRKKENAGKINSNFFLGKEPPNDYFSRQISAADGDGHKAEKVSTMKLQLSLDRLLENSVLSNPIDLIYSDLDVDRKRSKKTLYFVATHDLFISKDIRLNIELSANSCTETKSAPTVETRVEQQKTNLNEVSDDKK